MAKGQKRSAREKKKPKQEKSKPTTASPFATKHGSPGRPPGKR